MEGVASEAASLAGHLGLGRLVYVYDDNSITIDGSTDLAFSREDVEARFRAYGWHTQWVADGNDLEAIEAALRAGIAEESRPSLIRLTTVIGYGSPNRAGKNKAHGEALGVDEVRAYQGGARLGPRRALPRSRTRSTPPFATAAWSAGRRRRASGSGGSTPGRTSMPSSPPSGGPPRPARPQRGSPKRCRSSIRTTPAMSTRVAGGQVMQAFAPFVPTMIGGAADLVGSTFTTFKGEPDFTAEHAGRNIHWGIREHAMGSAVNGLALHGGIVKPFGSTFFVFTDYMRPAIRLSALMGIGVVWVFTHDSVAVGEDGPTHQPVEHLAAMRAIPGLTMIRPADATETAEAWRLVLEELSGPVCLVLTRQNVPMLDRRVLAPAVGVGRGAYVLADAESPEAVLVATGSEVSTALAARDLLADQGVGSASSRCRAGSSSRRSRPTTATRCCRRTCRRSRSRPGRRSAGRAGSTPSSAIDTLRRIGPGRRGARPLRDQPRGGRAARRRDDRRARQASRPSCRSASASPRASRSRRRSGS